MAVQQTSGGTAKDKQFVDTVGGFTGIGGSNHIVISTFKGLKVTCTEQKSTGHTFIQTSLIDLLLTAGYTQANVLWSLSSN